MSAWLLHLQPTYMPEGVSQCALHTQIEMAALASGNELLHGEAVNIDMALTTEVCYASSSPCRGALMSLLQTLTIHV